MDLAALILRILLGSVFLVSGFAKIPILRSFSRTLREFGLPAALALPSAALLVGYELTIAAALFSSAFISYGAWGALILLIAFFAGISLMLVRGRKPDCHCFGSLHSAPAGKAALLRIGILAACAGCLVLRVPVPPWPLIVPVSVVFGAFMIWMFRRPSHQDRATSAVSTGLSTGQGLPIGARAPEFSLPGLSGATCSLTSLRGRGHPVLLVFAEPGCEACESLLDSMAGRIANCLEYLNIVIVSRGTVEENLIKFRQHETSRVLLQRDSEIADAYDAPGAPAAVLVGAGGSIESELALGPAAVQQLFTRHCGSPANVTD